MPQYVHMNCNPDSGFKIKYTYCVRSMLMMKLKLAKVKTSDEASVAENGTVSGEDVDQVRKVLK